jgi:DNA replication protein DnaC
MERERHERLVKSGLPQRHLDALKDERRWEHAGYRESTRKAKAACEAGGLVAFVGNRGTGKTQAAVEVAVGMFAEHPVRYVKARMLGMYLRECYQKQGMGEAESIQRWVRPHLLIIDDAHELSDQKEYDRSMLTLLCDLRYDESRPTILIANVSPEKAQHLWGASIADRMNDGGGMIVFHGQSLRRSKHGAHQQEGNGGAAKPGSGQRREGAGQPPQG